MILKVKPSECRPPHHGYDCMGTVKEICKEPRSYIIIDSNQEGTGSIQEKLQTHLTCSRATSQDQCNDNEQHHSSSPVTATPSLETERNRLLVTEHPTAQEPSPTQLNKVQI